MFHPYSVHGGTATLDPQMTGQNGQSRIPEMFNGYPQNIAGSIPFNTIPTTPMTGFPTPGAYAPTLPVNPAAAYGYGVPQFVNPAIPTGYPYGNPGYFNPMMPFAGYNTIPTFNPTIPFGGYGIPQTTYPTPFVNPMNPFMNAYNPFAPAFNQYVNPVNPFANLYSPYNPYATTPVNTIPTTIVNTPFGPVCWPTNYQGFNPFTTGAAPFSFRGSLPSVPFSPTGWNPTTPFATTTPWNTGVESTLGWNNAYSTLNPQVQFNTVCNPLTGIPTNGFNPAITGGAWNAFAPNSLPYGVRPTFGGFNSWNPLATNFGTGYGPGTSAFGATPWGGLNSHANPFGAFGTPTSFSNPYIGYPTSPANPTMAPTAINPFSGVTNPFFNPTNIAFGIPGVNGQLNPTTGLTNCGPVCCN
ncbi:MAG: hypothetical protein AABZ08_00015 [Planctomycetota bacterium]